ncbi:mTERF [Carex littledalei]|uniref:mTERF n=1 Tax=Carex littledalei TaxID=544730 RepID=A0A833QV72_9POAL|nr:mTERF [Carex littledalei]
MSTLSPLSPSLPLHPQALNSQITPQPVSSRFQLSAFTPSLRSPTLPKIPLSPHEIPKIPSTRTLFDQKLHLLHSHGVDFSPSDLRRISEMCPELLQSSPCLISAAISFLLSEVDLSPSNLPHLLRRRPRLLLSPVKTRLRPAFFFLLSLDLTPVKDYAFLLCFSVEDKFLPRLDFLREIGFSHKEARSMVRRFPWLFHYSIEKNMRPKYEFLMKDMRRGLEELRDFPEYFSCSLENRILPRHEMCKRMGLRLSLPAMLRPGDAKFNSLLRRFGGPSLPVMDSPLWNAGVNSSIDNRI